MGAATLAIGLALQGTLSDLAAGFMLILFRPYKLGQYVDIGGTAGTVKDLNLFITELVTPDNVQIIVPNGQSWGSIITNYSAHDTRRVDLVFGIDYGDSADKAMGIILDAARADDRVHADPEPWARVTNLGDSSVDLTARLWCDAGDYWDLKFALTKTIKEAFDAQGISIPYPHTVEIKKAS
jgi:small conductance mechanosensitive channel